MPSTLIRKMSYDEERRILTIWFVPSGHRYEYEGVPPEVYAAMRSAFSKGSYFNAHIRDNYPYRLVDRGAAGG